MFTGALLLLALALTAPPSSTLTGPAGTLRWTVTSTGGTVTIDGASPKWTVHHVATPELRPLRTERRDAAGKLVTVDYAADGATVHMAGKELRVSGRDLWDGDTVDVRLGALAAQGRADVGFSAVDPASGTVYGFEARTVGAERCGAAACTHVHLVMTGMYRLVGPDWDYWYGADGRLLRFDGPIGVFSAADAG